MYAVPNIFATQSGNVPASQLDADFTALAAGVNNAFLVGLIGARPAPDGVGNGRYYFATDDNGGTLYRDNGAAWVAVAPGVGALPVILPWLPTLGGSATYIVQSGQSIKIGKLVFITGSLQVNVLGTGSNKQISGLPYPVALSSIGSLFFTGLPTNVSYATIAIQGGPDLITIHCLPAVGPSMAQLIPAFQNGTFIIFTGMYQTT